MDNRIHPNTLLIGACGTLGQAIAQKLADDSKKIALVDIDEAKLKELSARLPNSTYYVVNATNPQSVAALFDEAATRLDSVVLAVGIEGPVSNIEECPDEAFQKVMNVNVMSVWLGLKHAIRILKPKKKGSIVVVSSISGTMGMPSMAPYSASKHAVLGLVRTAAREAAASGVRINAVCPGPVSSDMMKRIDSTLADKHPERLNGRSDASGSVPMQRYANPEEIADTIAFLCSDSSSYITGATVMIDGGLTCR